VGGDPDGGTPADMAPEYPAWSASSPAICGQPAYTWQPTSSVGNVLDSSRNLLGVNTFVINTLKAVAFLGSQLNVSRAPTYNTHTATIRYQTQDRGKLVDATAMVTWPTGSTKKFPVLLFLHPTLGYTDECAPSAKKGDITAPMTILSLLMASAGYVTVFPDYLNQRSLGMASTSTTPYLLLEPTALVSLDAVRAAQKYVTSRESLSVSNDLYVWGHSQGAQAVEYVTAMQPLYAPEYSLKAAAAVSPPSDLPSSAKANFAGPAPTYNLGQAIAYTWSDYYDRAQIPLSLRSPWDMTALTQLKNYCNTSYTDPIKSVKDPLTVFTEPFLNTVTLGQKNNPWSCWLHYNNPATMSLPINKSVPMLYVTGDKDTTVIPAANDPVIASWCQQGAQIQYLQCAGADHVGTITDSIDDVFNFFDARQAGLPLPASVCTPQPATRCASAR
jgi:dienelactone hydrolase